MKPNLRSARSVSPQHPSKICDIIADRLVAEFLKHDPESIANITVTARRDEIRASGDVFSRHFVDYETMDAIVESVVGRKMNTIMQFRQLSGLFPVQHPFGAVFGYACDMTREMLPLEQVLSRSLCETIYHYKEFRTEGEVWVTIDLDDPLHLVKKIEIWWSDVTKEQVLEAIDVWLPVYTMGQKKEDIKIVITPTKGSSLGDESIYKNGQVADVDFYGSSVVFEGEHHLSGKCNLITRDGSYMARFIAVKILNENPDAETVAVNLRWQNPDSDKPSLIDIKINGETVTDIDVEKALDLTPKGIKKTLKMKKVDYPKTAEFGHFGHNFRWERRR